MSEKDNSENFLNSILELNGREIDTLEKVIDKLSSRVCILESQRAVLIIVVMSLLGFAAGLLFYTYSKTGDVCLSCWDETKND